jgi:hypothetical protein
MGGWHHNDLTIATRAPEARGDPAGYVFDAQGSRHVVYRGNDHHIHQLWWDNNGSHHIDLTIAAGAPDAGSDPAGYVFDAQGTQHVVYRGFDDHIHELWWNADGWHHNDLTVAAGAPEASLESSPTGYVFNAQGTQHVIYLAVRQIHELWWDNNVWRHNNLTIAGGAPTGRSGGSEIDDPAGYVFDAEGTQHVVYRDSVSKGTHVHELWWNADGWHHSDLNIAAGAPTGTAFSVAGNPAGYAFDVLGTQHVVYRSLDGHIHKLWFSNNSWHHYDLTIAAGAPEEPGWPISCDPVGYIFGAYAEQHVLYRSIADGHIHQLWFGHKGWHYIDLTIAAGAPEASGDPAGYVSDAQRTEYVIYRGNDHHIHELRWDTETEAMLVKLSAEAKIWARQAQIAQQDAEQGT